MYNQILHSVFSNKRFTKVFLEYLQFHQILTIHKVADIVAMQKVGVHTAGAHMINIHV